MDPPDAPSGSGGLEYEAEDGSSVHSNGLELEGDSGGVELQPLVGLEPDDAPFEPQPRRSRQPAAPTAGSKVAYAKNADDGAAERVASALSNEGILNGLERLRAMAAQASASVGDRVASGGAPAAAGDRFASGSAPAAAPTLEEEGDSKRKKMLLLVMLTLFVALLGAALDKYKAVEVEHEIEEGETEQAFHEPKWKGLFGKGGSDKTEKGAGGGGARVINVEGYQPKTMVNVSDYILPGTEDAPPLSAAKGRPYFPILNHFQHRDPTSAYASKWGAFLFEDPDKKWDGKMRPQPDFTKAPNRDVANDDFPEGAWQKDRAYMEAFLKQAKLLVNRSIEGVYDEYGVGIPQDGSLGERPDAWWLNRNNFHAFKIKKNINEGGGGSWTTQQSVDGMARRFIHHIMTGDTMKLTLGGHSAAAGHGAGFNQSFIIEAGHVLEPVFAHLGVEFRAYNFAQGGMGTFQQALAGMDLRNKETDWIMWDSRMTERVPAIAHFFFRQAIIAGNRSPVLMAEGMGVNEFHNHAGAAVCGQGMGWVPVTVSAEQVKDVPWAAQYLQCARGSTVDCNAHQYTAGCWVEREDFKPPTGQNPLVGGQAGWHPGNRIHKRRGRMIALIVLKCLAYALDKWEEIGTEAGYPIPESQWHVTDYYANIRAKTKTTPGCWGNTWRIGQARKLEELVDEDGVLEEHSMVDENGRKLQATDFWPPRICNLPLQGRSLWGPRDNPMETSLLSIMRKNPMGDIEPEIKTNGYMQPPCYQPPDRPAPWTVPPSFLRGDEDPEASAPWIGWSRRLSVEGEEEKEEKQRQLRGLETMEGHASGNFNFFTPSYGESSGLKGSQALTRHLADGEAPAEDPYSDPNKIVPGLGLWVKWGRTGVCDGSSHHWCDKGCGSGCLMGGTQDNRGMVCFTGLSGWAVFDIKDVKHGFIGARMEPWHRGNEMSTTRGWSSVNNGGKGNYGKRGRERELHEEAQRQTMQEGFEEMEREIEQDILAEGDHSRRRLGGGQSCGWSSYTFEWALNGEVVTWPKGEYCNHFTRLSYNLDVIKFLDDESKTGDFELAMRLTNCKSECVMCLSHLYWA
ncbi:hypothetical protein ACHAXT_012142 [Thalassiosira profunda]